MGIRVPRISLKADYEDESALGELSLISLGYGLHQAWIYATMFGNEEVFGILPYLSAQGFSFSVTFVISIIFFGLSLLFAAATDRKFLHIYLSKKSLITAAALTSLGTLLLLMPLDAASLDMPLEIISGIATGIGTALLILFWGTSFARCDSATIVLNTAIAIVVGVSVYVLVLRQIPFPFSGVAAAALPLLELLILRKKTSWRYFQEGGIPLFNPLPVKRGKFILKFGLPVFIFGLALGVIRHMAVQNVMSATAVEDQFVLLLAACFATVLILVTLFALGGSNQWNRYFQPLIPFIGVMVFFLPLSESGNVAYSEVFLLMGYMCFEALMWLFFGELAQRFRLSPVFVYGIGRGLLALAALTGSLLPIVTTDWMALVPFDQSTLAVFLLLVMVIAFALLPREKEIEAIVAPSTMPGESEPAEPAEGSTDVEQKKSGWFRNRCELVANHYLLSQRETEVLFFLAKGHNSAYIQEKLFISEGTAKTHIRHIYKKLNVHNQQELMRAVEHAEELEQANPA